MGVCSNFLVSRTKQNFISKLVVGKKAWGKKTKNRVKKSDTKSAKEGQSNTQGQKS